MTLKHWQSGVLGPSAVYDLAVNKDMIQALKGAVVLCRCLLVCGREGVDVEVVDQVQVVLYLLLARAGKCAPLPFIVERRVWRKSTHPFIAEKSLVSSYWPRVYLDNQLRDSLPRVGPLAAVDDRQEAAATSISER